MSVLSFIAGIAIVVYTEKVYFDKEIVSRYKGLLVDLYEAGKQWLLNKLGR